MTDTDPSNAQIGSPKAKVSWPRIWDQSFHPAKDDEARAFINLAAARCLKMQAAVSAAATQPAIRAALRLLRRYLASNTAKLNAFARAYERHTGPLRDAKPGELCEIVEVAQALNVWKSTEEKSIAYPKLKRCGQDYRYIHKHQIFLYAQELMMADAARAICKFLPTQFMTNGGQPAYTKWLRQNLPIVKLVITVDIPRCFDHVDRSSVVDHLLLPERAVRRVLFDPMDHATYLTHGLIGFVPMSAPIVKVSAPKRGIPQGSALSPIASEVVVGEVLKAVLAHNDVQAGCQGDNLIFLLEDAKNKESVIASLTSSIAKHFGSDVASALTYRIECQSPSKGFWFCQRFYSLTGSKLKMAVPSNFVDKFAIKTMSRIEEAKNLKNYKKLESIRRSIKGWMGQNIKIKDVVDEAAELLALLPSLKNSPSI